MQPISYYLIIGVLFIALIYLIQRFIKERSEHKSNVLDCKNTINALNQNIFEEVKKYNTAKSNFDSLEKIIEIKINKIEALNQELLDTGTQLNIAKNDIISLEKIAVTNELQNKSKEEFQLNQIDVLNQDIEENLKLLALAKLDIFNLQEKYKNIISIENEVSLLLHERNEIQFSIDSLRKSYREKKELFDKLVVEAAIYDELIALAELGFYKPHFSFDASEKFKAEIELVKEEQKRLIRDKTAIYCTAEWTVHGSKSEGQKMTNRNIRLTARAFNNECDACIASTKWNNAERMEERIGKAFELINKLNEPNMIFISLEFFNLKIKEFRLTYEYKDMKQKEREEQAMIRQQMREEAKLLEEVDEAIKEEDRYQKMLDRAIQEAERASGAKLQELNKKVQQLTVDLAAAHEKSQRALSMAQQTKAGHVYIISNLGSFGDDVYKIGMTRRLEPIDRVKELGDASVPFTFDVHAMIYSEDAPALEYKLHKLFDQRRLNLVNNRKEFFRVSLDSIERAVQENFKEVEFIRTAEAREHKESQAIRALASQTMIAHDVRKMFPNEI